jgi:ComF family protein
MVQGGLADRTASTLLNIVFPSDCPVCGRGSDSIACSPICASCWGGIERYGGTSCRICSEPFVSKDAHTCGRCLSERPPFRRAICYGIYAGALKEAIHQLKFHSARRLSGGLGRLLAEMDIPGADCIVPVPLTARGLRQRGFNHSQLISRALSGALGLPLDIKTLYKKKDTPPQVGLSRRARLENLKGAFGFSGRLQGGTVLLVDDVITTGATARECAKTLIKAGADKVYAVSPARGAMTAMPVTL